MYKTSCDKQASFKELGGEIVYKKSYTINSTNLSQVADSLKKLNPDVCYLPDQETNAVRLMKFFNGKGVSTRFIGGDGWNATMYPVTGNEIRGSLYTSHWHPDVETEISKTFVRNLRKNVNPDESLMLQWALSVDAVNLLLDSASRAKSLDSKSIRDALAATSNFEGITGNITFDEHRNPVKPAVILEFNKDGKSVDYVKQILP